MPKGFYPREPLADRYWRHVIKTDDCWQWTGRVDKDGYGKLKFDYKQLKANRVSWELHFGPIPPGAWVLHTCDNPPCTRPDHLFLGTHADNMKDRHAKRRDASGSGHGRAKLTESDIPPIRAALAAGESMTSIGKRYGVNSGTIFFIAAGKHWQHVI